MDRVWVVPLLVMLFGAVGAAGYLFLPRHRSSADQARLSTAAARVDGELAGNLELVTMFGQTKQPVVMENASYLEARETIAVADGRLGRRLDALYELIPYAEAAMERRGPAGSIKSEDLATVHNWEGGARDLQRALRDLPGTPPPTPWTRLVDWTRRTRSRGGGAGEQPALTPGTVPATGRASLWKLPGTGRATERGTNGQT
jgi:hypothetical protein